MSQALMDYVSAIHDVLAGGLAVLSAEHQLSDEDASTLVLLAAETSLDEAAGRLTDAVDGLDRDRRPVGWHEPPAVSGVPPVARSRVLKAVLRVLSAQHAGETPDADAESEYADEQLAVACRNLAADVAECRAVKAQAGGRLL